MKLAAFLVVALLPVSAARVEPRKAANVLWRNPGNVVSKSFEYGPGGRAHSPLPPFHFVKEDLSGSNPKIEVKDSHGTLWSVKWSEEAKAEVFASRLAWACGYIAQPEYFVAEGRVLGVKSLGRASSSVAPDGSFQNARFQLRSKWPKFLKKNSWAWNYNPFVGTRELNGLKILMMLTSNWDNKDARDIDRDSNLAIFESGTRTRPVFLYFVADWGASMGKWGHVYNRSKWDCKGFSQQTLDFVKGRKHGIVQFGYTGQHTEDAAFGIRESDVSWLLGYLGRITDTQLRAGLKASGASPQEVACFTRSLRDRIDQLRSVAR